jgi:hypothetical protein
MGAIHQLASASLAAAFLIGMVIAAHLFVEYRAAKSPAIWVVAPIGRPV